MNQAKTLGVTLKEARAGHSMSLRDVERQTGFSNAFISQVENDQVKSPGFEVIVALSRLYSLDLDTLADLAFGEKRDPADLQAPCRIFVREAWGELADQMKRGEVVQVDVASLYARQGSHWIAYVLESTAVVMDSAIREAAASAIRRFLEHEKPEDHEEGTYTREQLELARRAERILEGET